MMAAPAGGRERPEGEVFALVVEAEGDVLQPEIVKLVRQYRALQRVPEAPPAEATPGGAKKSVPPAAEPAEPAVEARPILVPQTEKLLRAQTVAFSPDGRSIASGSSDHVIVWDATTGELQETLDHAGASSVAFSPDGEVLASQSDAQVVLWDLATGEQIRTLTPQPGVINLRGLRFSPDGSTLASGWDGCTLYDVATGEPKQTVGAQGEPAFSPDGETMAVGRGNDVVLFDRATGNVARVLAGPTDAGFRYVSSVAFSPDGKTVASATENEGATILLWDVATGRQVRALTGPGIGGRSVAFSPDGKTIASAVGGAAVLLDAATGKRKRTFAGIAQPYGRTLAFSPDGKALALVESSGAVCLREVATGRRLAALYAFDGGKAWLAATPKGYYTGSANVGEHIRWRNAGDQTLLPADKYAAKCRRPDLVAAALRGKP
jgi:Tol biopolymer transport system component